MVAVAAAAVVSHYVIRTELRKDCLQNNENNEIVGVVNCGLLMLEKSKAIIHVWWPMPVPVPRAASQSTVHIDARALVARSCCSML